MKYSKQPLDYSEILDLLASRGLIIADRNKAIECLKVVSYFRLDNYFHPMESDKIRHIFNPTLPFAPRFLRCISNLTMAVCVTVYYRFCLS